MRATRGEATQRSGSEMRGPQGGYEVEGARAGRAALGSGQTQPPVWGRQRRFHTGVRCGGAGGGGDEESVGRWGAREARLADGLSPAQAGCLPLKAGSGEAHHTLPWARRSRLHSRPLRHTSSARGYSGPSPCSGTHPLRRSSGLQGAAGGEGRLLAGAGGWGVGWGGAREQQTLQRAGGFQGHWATHCNWRAHRCRPHSRCPGHRPRLGGCSAW